MAGWLRRMVGAPTVRSSTAPPTQHTASQQRVPEAAAAPLQPVHAVQFTTRRPLVSTQGAIAGYEFRLAGAVEQRLRQRSDPVAQAANAIALLSSMRETIAASRVAMTSMPAEVLARPAVMEAASLAYVVLEPPAEPAQANATTLEGRSRGLRIGVHADPAQAMTNCDFIVLRCGDQGLPDLEEQVAHWRSLHPALPLVALDLNGIDELERCLALNVTLASLRLQSLSNPTSRQAPRPAVALICRVLAQLRDECHGADVARQLGADVALSYRLLRWVNSPAFGLTRSVTSIEEAVMLLGHGGLNRWLSIALLANADGRRASRALQEVSLARARFMEMLAADRGRDPPQALFTVGLLSLLDQLLQTPMAEALAPLHLSDPAMQALLQRRGPWTEYLALASDIEANRMASAESCAAAFGGLEAALRKSHEAWQWAASIMQTLQA